MTCNPCYVVSAATNTFKVSATLGGAAQTLSGNGTGYHTAKVDWSWQLQSGTSTTAVPTNPVTLAVVGTNMEITNGLTGFRVPTTAGWSSPNAPIQGVKLRDGTWAASAGPNKMYEALNVNTQHTGLSGYQLRVLESGPLFSKIQPEYTTNRPEYDADPSTVIGADAGADTITLDWPAAATCEQWNQQGASGFYTASGTMPGGITAGNQYTLRLVGGCTFNVFTTPSTTSIE